MSHGILKNTKDGSYFYENPSNPLSSIIFENQQYVAPDSGAGRFLQKDLNFPKESFLELNTIIGGFLKTIQDGSFVPRSIIDAIPSFQSPVITDMGTDLEDYSTLRPFKLAEIIEKNLANTIYKIIPLLRVETQTRLREVIESARALHEKRRIFAPPALLNSSESEGLPLKEIPIITKEAEILLNGFAEGCPDVVEKMLKFLGERILTRAHLSLNSLRNDITDIKDNSKREAYETAEYSTLNPEQFIEAVQQSINGTITGLLEIKTPK